MTKHTSPIVEAEGLTKKFGPRIAVNNISFKVFPGDVVGFLGPNGAGKTTTIRMLLNILRPNSGHLSLFGMTYSENRTEILRQINASSGTLTLPGKLSVFENLGVFADLYGISQARVRIHQVADQFELGDFLKKPLYSLSTGQQVRVSLAKAFLNRPRLLLLDEPSASLDPDVAERVRTYIQEAVRDEGTTVFLTSHNMREVETLCTRVLFINSGSIQAEGSPRELTRQVRRWRVNITTDKELREIPGGEDLKPIHTEIDGNRVTFELDRKHVGPLLSEIVRAGYRLEKISVHEPTLEDFFVKTARAEME